MEDNFPMDKGWEERVLGWINHITFIVHFISIMITSHLSEWLSKTSTKVGEDVEKTESLYTASENVNWCSRNGKYYGNCSKNDK